MVTNSGYVRDTSYDAAGRMVRRTIGAGGALVQQYSYYPWSQQAGRLQQIQGGISSNPTSLLNLSYAYRCNGKSRV